MFATSDEEIHDYYDNTAQILFVETVHKRLNENLSNYLEFEEFKTTSYLV